MSTKLKLLAGVLLTGALGLVAATSGAATHKACACGSCAPSCACCDGGPCTCTDCLCACGCGAQMAGADAQGAAAGCPLCQGESAHADTR